VWLDASAGEGRSEKACPRESGGHAPRRNQSVSVNPTQTFIYFLRNRVGSPSHGSCVGRTCAHGGLARWLPPARYARPNNPDRARSAGIKATSTSGVENISSIANSDSRWALRRQERVIALFEHSPKWHVGIVRMAREVLCRHSEWKSL